MSSTSAALQFRALDLKDHSKIDALDIRISIIYDVLMRTTLTIEEDVAQEIQKLRRSQGLSLKSAVNQLLRAGLTAGSKPVPAKPYRSRARPLGLRAGFDPARLNQAVDELEVT